MKLLSRLSLRTKIALCVGLVVLLVGLATVLLARQILTAKLTTELEERGRSVATGLEARSVDHILRGNFFELHQMIQETRFKGKDVRYIFVLDPKGNVIDHTFESGFPTDLLSLPGPGSELEYRTQLLQTEEGFIRDIAVPVFDGKAGVLHVGMAETYISAAVAGVVRNLLIATGAALLVGVALAWFLAHLVTRPVLRLVGVAEAVGGGDLTRRASIATRDEVGRLGRAFDGMTEQLATRIEELEATNLQLSALNDIATLVSRTTPLGGMLSEILEKLLDLVQADTGGTLFRGREKKSGYWAHVGFSQAYVEGVADLMLNSNEEAERFLSQAEYPASESNPVDPGLLSWIEREGLKTFVSAPFRVKGEMAGALHVARRAKLPFTPRERELLSSVAAQTGIMLTNRQLLKEASQAEALRQLNQMKSEFALRASHELRTPATAIKGYIETLLRPDMALGRKEQKQLLEDMDEVSDRLNRLIQDVLNVARIDSGGLDVRKERLALHPLLQRITRRLGRQSSRHRLVVKSDKNVGEILGDTDRLEDVLENLISNALKYSPKGGTVTVSARNSSLSEDDDQLRTGKTSELRAQPTGFVTVSVADEGIGIPAEEVAKLFQQFYQVPGKSSTRSGGIGMGLFICKSYVEAMGGKIWVESEEGNGSTFNFTIPAAGISQKPSLRRGQAPPVADGGGGN